MPRHDPLRNPEPLIREVYAYVAYRIGGGADAEDITSEVFERVVRYRQSFDPARGTPIEWLIGIARNVHRSTRAVALLAGRIDLLTLVDSSHHARSYCERLPRGCHGAERH
jgi:DNA-directed RNA polymerase specialized sigma24 family protein